MIHNVFVTIFCGTDSIKHAISHIQIECGEYSS